MSTTITTRNTPADRYRTGVLVALAGVMMMFTALTSAYIVRAGTWNDWRPVAMPRLLWVSTGVILLSSLAFEVARRALRLGRNVAFKRWLLVTVVLGLGFLASQLMVWRELAAAGVYLASNPHSAFFYVLTGVHGLHLLGGILALDYLLLRTLRNGGGHDEGGARKRRAVVNAAALYWHFMFGVWIYLFLLLFLWR
ncbi:MAG TPA: cytochrome c oxidase subunit 3 [Pyrinomonadaceae bacterium]|nr:cytochrome c oxidase subunit 3 [Pyrinomonadaceae bacterium]